MVVVGLKIPGPVDCNEQMVVLDAAFLLSPLMLLLLSLFSPRWLCLVMSHDNLANELS